MGWDNIVALVIFVGLWLLLVTKILPKIGGGGG